MKLRFSMILLTLTLLNNANIFVMAQSLIEKRPYEPVIIKGGSRFNGFPAQTSFLYKYDAASSTWAMMPFQIDEVLRIETAEDTTWTHFEPDTDPAIDGNDELVFMIRDMGDQASSDSWIDNAESIANGKRLEIKIADPKNNDLSAYCYLYTSSTITDAVPTPYTMSYDPINHIVNTSTYQLQLEMGELSTGVVQNVKIHPPFGNDVEFFDTQKFRFAGLMEFGFGSLSFGRDGSPFATEWNIITLNADNPYYVHQYTQNPVVRLIREMRSAIRVEAVLDDKSFENIIKFYPYNATLSGGAMLSEDVLAEALNTEDEIYIEIDQLRQSWDLNKNSTGMRFYNVNNDGLLIDGQPDSEVNTSLPNKNDLWTLVSGEQGSFFSYYFLQDTVWETTGLYYYDNANGGQGDIAEDEGWDTGDQMSYGDHGFLLHNDKPSRTVDLTLAFNAYFLEKNLTQKDGRALNDNIQNKVYYTATRQSITSISPQASAIMPQNSRIAQSYPNPFNGRIHTPLSLVKSARVKAVIYDVSGRMVQTLQDAIMPAGSHILSWHPENSDAQHVPSGIYFLHIQIGHKMHTQKLMYLQ